MNRFTWDWSITELKPDKPVKVLTTFSCGGGSSMGYKRAGFEVLGNVEIDPKINAMYKKNHHPKYNYEMDLRDFNAKEDLPKELYNLDILDGSPPCSTFSMAGKREAGWGVEKQFREGQKMQRLDDLFFVWLDTVEKLKPKIAIAENVVGLIAGNARGYVNEVLKRFKEIGYSVQMFRLNAAKMDVPQARERVFVIGNRMEYGPLRLNFNHDSIPFGVVRSGEGKPVPAHIAKLMPFVKATDRDFGDTAKRVLGRPTKFSYKINADDQVVSTITSGGGFIRFADKRFFNDTDILRVQTFPRDYDFNGNKVQYVCGMSVPPNMMANIATEIWEQWLSKELQ